MGVWSGHTPINTLCQPTLSTHPLNTLCQPTLFHSISEEDDDPDWAFGLNDADDPDALYAPSDEDDDEREMNALYDMNQQASSDDMMWEVGRRIDERPRKRPQRDDDDGSTKGDSPVAFTQYIYHFQMTPTTHPYNPHYLSSPFLPVQTLPNTRQR